MDVCRVESDARQDYSPGVYELFRPPGIDFTIKK